MVVPLVRLPSLELQPDADVPGHETLERIGDDHGEAEDPPGPGHRDPSRPLQRVVVQEGVDDVALRFFEEADVAHRPAHQEEESKTESRITSTMDPPCDWMKSPTGA